jgi:hypothetical protein
VSKTRRGRAHSLKLVDPNEAGILGQANIVQVKELISHIYIPRWTVGGKAGQSTNDDVERKWCISACPYPCRPGRRYRAGRQFLSDNPSRFPPRSVPLPPC